MTEAADMVAAALSAQGGEHWYDLVKMTILTTPLGA
jgi:hypothetical protein